MVNNTAYLEFDFKENGGVSLLRSYEEVESFANTEAQFWGWLTSNQTYHLPYNIEQHLTHKFSSMISDLNSTLSKRNAYASEEDFKRAITEKLNTYFIEQKIPTSFSALGEFINEQRKIDSLRIKAGLTVYLNIFREINKNPSDYIFFQGANLISSFQLGINPNTSSIESMLSKTQSQCSKSISNMDLEAKSIWIKNSEKIDLFIKDGGKKIEEIKKSQEQYYSRIIPDSDAAIASLKNTETTFKEKMKLQAPVKYWSDKMKKHRKYSIAYGTISLIIAIAGIGLLNYTLSKISSGTYEISQNIINISTGTKEIKGAGNPIIDNIHFVYYPLFISSLLIILSLYFWILRLSVRLTLSEHHLSIDAHERSIMVTTYLALSNEGLLDEKDRSLVLTPLFRPSPDGFVKEDSSPDIMLSAVLSKYLSRQ